MPDLRSVRCQPEDGAHDFWRDAALPYVESRRACHSRACYKPHSHPTYSIGAVDVGASVFTGAIDGPVRLHPGTVVFVPAMRMHACNPEPETAWSYQMLHLDAQWLRAVRAEYSPGLDGASLQPEPVRIVRDARLYRRFCQLNAVLFSTAPAGDKEAALIAFIGDSDGAQGLRVDTPALAAGLAERLLPAMQTVSDAPGEALALQDLARRVGMSRYQFIRAVRAATGMTPHAWQLNLRVNLARDRLRSGARLADLAQHLGFADQAHFQRVFKAYAAVTPGRYQVQRYSQRGAGSARLSYGSRMAGLSRHD